jgi:diadenosine tetraphosphate (Ap4A) HIT family hydrolase
VSERGCVICRQGGPCAVIAERASVWVTAPPAAPLPGYACVVAKTHVVEPFELPAEELHAFWRDAMSVAGAIHRLLRPLKMNYEIHGNTTPHLHLHLYPRFTGDPYEGGPIDGRSTRFQRSRGDLDRMRAALEETPPPGG